MLKNSSWVEYKPALAQEYALLTFLISLFILLNNIVVLSIFLRVKKREVMDYLIISLAISDLLTLVPHALITAVLISRSIWLTTNMCNFLGVLRIATIGSTTWIHSALCIHKTLSIANPLAYPNHASGPTDSVKCVLCVVIIFCFLGPTLVCVTLLIEGSLLRIAFDVYEASCTYVSDLRLYAALGSCFLVLPLIIQIITHGIILHKVQKMSSANHNRCMRTFRAIVATLAIFYICRVPFFIFILWKNLPINSKPPVWFEVIQRHAVTLNSATSTVIYYKTLRKFRVLFKSTIIKLSSSQIHPEPNS